MDFSTYTDPGNPKNNASLKDGHLAQRLLALGGFTITSLWAEHPTQAIEKRIPEFTMLEAAEASGKLADSGTMKGQDQRNKIANDQDTADSELANSAAGAGFDIGTSLKTEGLDENTPVFLFIEVRRNAEDLPESYTVGPVIAKYRADIAKGDAYTALKDVFTGPENTFVKKYPDMSIDGLVGTALLSLPGIAPAALAALPK